MFFIGYMLMLIIGIILILNDIDDSSNNEDEDSAANLIYISVLIWYTVAIIIFVLGG